jgi:hypothetical protein
MMSRSDDKRSFEHGELRMVHVGGRLQVRMDEGTEADLAAGDAHYVSAGHEACIVIDFSPVAQAAATQDSELRSTSCPTCSRPDPAVSAAPRPDPLGRRLLPGQHPAGAVTVGGPQVTP